MTGSLKNGRDKYTISVDTEKIGEDIKVLTDIISEKVIGQNRAISHVLRLFATDEVGLRDENRPIGVMIFAGPSGVGKTLAAKETARAFLGQSKYSKFPITIIQCPNLREDHKISSLLGSPPGYVGYNDLPILHQFNIDKQHLFIKVERSIESARSPAEKNARKHLLSVLKQVLSGGQVSGPSGPMGMGGPDPKQILTTIFDEFKPLKSIVLFDEIEKANPRIWDLLLGILEDGEVQLANGEITSFRNSFILMTTNVGSREIKRLTEKPMGFEVPSRAGLRENVDKLIYEETKKALSKMFRPEFVGRLGKEIVVFRMLGDEDYLKILNIFLSEIQERLSGKKIKPPPILLNYSDNFKKFLVKEGSSQEYGARILRDVVKKYVESPLAFAISSGELIPGDKVLFDVENERPVLLRQPRPENLLLAPPGENKPDAGVKVDEPDSLCQPENGDKNGNGNGNGDPVDFGDKKLLIPIKPKKRNPKKSS